MDIKDEPETMDELFMRIEADANHKLFYNSAHHLKQAKRIMNREILRGKIFWMVTLVLCVWVTIWILLK